MFGKKIAIPAFLIIIAVLSSCFSPWEPDEAVVTINLGGVSGRAAEDDGDITPGDVIPYFYHKITIFSGESIVQSSTTEKGALAVRLTVAPGRYDIIVQALMDPADLEEFIDSVEGGWSEPTDTNDGNSGGNPDGNSGSGGPGDTATGSGGGGQGTSEGGDRSVQISKRAIDSDKDDDEEDFEPEIVDGKYLIAGGLAENVNVVAGKNNPVQITMNWLVPTGEGGEDYDGYIINLFSSAELALIGKSPDYPLNGNYLLMNDINISSYENWTPIGGNFTITYNDEGKSVFTPLNYFSGTFDGNGKKIIGLNISFTSSEHIAGLFGYVVPGGTVKNLGVEGININISEDIQSVGGIMGINYGTVENCYVTGTVSGARTVGGVVGFNTGTVSNCYSTATVISSNDAGGIAGANFSTVSNCYSTGGVSGTTNVGGVVGQNGPGIDIDAIVKNCYSIGNISGNNSVGGVVGANRGMVSNSYAMGNVSGDLRIGGVAGSNSDSAIVQYCVALNSSVIKLGASIGGVGRVVGESSGTLDQNYAYQFMDDGNGEPFSMSEREVIKIDGADIDTTLIEDESWWKDPIRWRSVWGGTDEFRPWIWDSTNNLPILWFEQRGGGGTGDSGGPGDL